MSKVIVFGAFDGLHEGHLNFLKQARNFGDYLVVVVARDKNIFRIKNHFPNNTEKQRFSDIRECGLANEVRLGYESDPYKIIEEIKPDVICLGYDQKSFNNNLKEKLKRKGLEPRILTMKSYKSKKFHSSILYKLKVKC